MFIVGDVCGHPSRRDNQRQISKLNAYTWRFIVLRPVFSTAITQHFLLELTFEYWYQVNVLSKVI